METNKCYQMFQNMKIYVKGLLDGLLGVGMIMKLVSQWIIPENSLRK